MPAASKVTASIFDPTVAWSTYTPSWTTSGTAPAIGNGSINGRYQLIGPALMLSIRLVAGTTTTFGTGSWVFSFPPLGRFSVNTWTQVLKGVAAPAGVPYDVTGNVLAGGNTVNLQSVTGIADTRLVGVDATHPATWTATSSNFLVINGAIELA